MAVQFSQHYLLKNLSFPYCILLSLLLYIYWSYKCIFIYVLYILFHWYVCLFLGQKCTVLITKIILNTKILGGGLFEVKSSHIYTIHVLLPHLLMSNFLFLWLRIIIIFSYGLIWASLVAQMVNNPSAMWETWVRSLVWEKPLEMGMAIHSSILAWRIPWTEELGRLQSMGSQKVGCNWVAFFFFFFFFTG